MTWYICGGRRQTRPKTISTAKPAYNAKICFNDSSDGISGVSHQAPETILYGNHVRSVNETAYRSPFYPGLPAEHSTPPFVSQIIVSPIPKALTRDDMGRSPPRRFGRSSREEKHRKGVYPEMAFLYERPEVLDASVARQVRSPGEENTSSRVIEGNTYESIRTSMAMRIGEEFETSEPNTINSSGARTAPSSTTTEPPAKTSTDHPRRLPSKPPPRNPLRMCPPNSARNHSPSLSSVSVSSATAFVPPSSSSFPTYTTNSQTHSRDTSYSSNLSFITRERRATLDSIERWDVATAIPVAFDLREGLAEEVEMMHHSSGIKAGPTIPPSSQGTSDSMAQSSKPKLIRMDSSPFAEDLTISPLIYARAKSSLVYRAYGFGLGPVFEVPSPRQDGPAGMIELYRGDGIERYARREKNRGGHDTKAVRNSWEKITRFSMQRQHRRESSGESSQALEERGDEVAKGKTLIARVKSERGVQPGFVMGRWRGTPRML